jgi:hypothetical protein
MSRTATLCGLALATENEACCELAAYRVEANTYDGKKVVLHLCFNHVHRSWQLAQATMDRKYPNDGLKVRSIHMHQLPKASAAEAAS